MSLVAYGASDESETSDVEEAETVQATASTDNSDRALADDGKISDEEDYVPTVSANSNNDGATSSTNDVRVALPVSVPSDLSDLPAPKPSSSSVSQVDGVGNGEDELEDEVKPKASQLADAPKPPPKKVKQPARIVIPALKQDSDGEEDESKKKAKQPVTAAGSGSRSGLFALLPPPTHTSGKQTNRPLIPYTLTKRPTPTKTSSKPVQASSQPSSTTTTADTTLPSQKHQSAFNALTGYESDSDDDEAGPVRGVNFFSIGSKSGEATTSVPVVKNCAPALGDTGVRTSSDSTADTDNLSSSLEAKPLLPSAKSESPVLSSSSVSTSAATGSSSAAAEKVEDSMAGGDDENGGDSMVSSTVGIPIVDQDEPLTFSSSMQARHWSSAPLISPMLPEMYAAQSSNSAADYWQQQQHNAAAYSAGMDQEVESVASSSGGSSMQQYMEDEQFLRISGKRKRGQEEIQIIDANVDDYVDPGDLMKGISEESSYQPHRKKDNMPSHQQKRKKQITYLAFQAKERELELKNAWSQNRMTKNQARSKYGF